MKENEQQFKKLLERIEELKKGKQFDLSMEEDLSIAVMNLVSLEEHFFFTASKTGKKEYFDLMGEVRNVRKAMLAKMIDAHEGETWCISKHLLAATMRLIEVGTKLQSDGKRDEAEDVFKKAYRIYSLFWAVRLKLVDLKGAKKISSGKLNIHDTKEEVLRQAQDKPWSVEDIVNKLVNCCDE